METIDILVPVYNCEKYLAKCLDSILNQTYKDIVIKIVDDGSTDKSAKIILDYAKRYSNIEFYQKKNEKSITKTRNFLLEKITSPYFTFFDADDWAEPTYIESLYSSIKLLDSLGNKAGMSLCGKVRHKENKVIPKSKLYSSNKLILMNQEEAISEMLSSNLYNGTVSRHQV